MPVDHRSRYYGLGTQEVTTADGDRRPSIPLRPTLPVPGRPTYRHVVIGVEDIEYLAWRYYGDGRQWWRIADANALRFPSDLRPGDTLLIPGRGEIGTVVRDRRF